MEIMEAHYGILGIILIIVGFIITLLPIILFFKVWGMCNDVKRIKEIMERDENNDSIRSV